MSERKAYRVRQSGVSGEYFCPNHGGHPYLALPWPEDCPWDIESFPLPGEAVQDRDGDEWTVLGPPVKVEGDWLVVGRWDVNVEGYPAQRFPSIWNARREAQEGRDVGFLDIGKGGAFAVTPSVDDLGPGRYIIRREDP